MHLLALVALAGCHSNEPITAASFNAGLAVGFVTSAQERKQPVADAIAGVDADLVCLQEVWDQDARDAMIASTAANFPYNYFMQPLAPDMSGPPACATGDLDSLIHCADTQCADACTDDVVDCVFTQCAFPFLSLPKDCQACVMAQVGGSPDAIQATCESEPPSYAYGNSFGIGLLSKYPITSTEETVFDSTTNRRGLIHAAVDGPNGPMDAWCTHLSAVFAVIPYPHDTGSWAEEQAAQIDELTGLVASNSTSDFTLVMGDMNAGPAGGINVAEQPANYQKFLDAGYKDPYAAQADPGCTYCTDNPLVANDPNNILDHVFTTTAFDGTATPSRILDGTLDTTSCGAPITGAYSDHYGIRVSFTP